MLTKKTFLLAIRNIQTHDDLMHKADALFKPFGDFAPRLDSGSLHLEALLAVLREAMHDTGDCISWWLFEEVDHTISWEENGETVSVTLATAEDLYDYLTKYYNEEEAGQDAGNGI